MSVRYRPISTMVAFCRPPSCHNSKSKRHEISEPSEELLLWLWRLTVEAGIEVRPKDTRGLDLEGCDHVRSGDAG